MKLHSTRGGGGLTPCGMRWKRRVPTDHSERVMVTATSYDDLVTCERCRKRLALASPGSAAAAEEEHPNPNKENHRG